MTVIGPEEDTFHVDDAFNKLDEMIEALTFLQAEWSAADKYLDSLGAPAKKEDEFGDEKFIPLEERIRRVVNG